MSDSVVKKIKKWVVNDYFTPNIKAEVILDTLLTPCIKNIVQKQCSNVVGKELKFVTKEMSIKEQEKEEQKGNRGTKIDYILVDDEYVYLVELKTASSSIRNKQVMRYITNCAEKEFGEVLGNKLVKIMKSESVNTEKEYTAKDMEKVFEDRFDKYKNEFVLSKGNYADQARELLKKKGLYSTNKYLYTIGQILDYMNDNNEIWNKKLKLIYITPYGDSVLPEPPEDGEDKKKEWVEKYMKKWEALYIKPNNSESVSLRDWATDKEENEEYDEDYNEDYVKFLKGIIEELYPER